uniref:Uncharacterized protein n=1 Tax=Sphaerodactylus townsendi TaxID=933632 RepID=A0ACB8F8J7_9SAUR
MHTEGRCKSNMGVPSCHSALLPPFQSTSLSPARVKMYSNLRTAVSTLVFGFAVERLHSFSKKLESPSIICRADLAGSAEWTTRELRLKGPKQHCAAFQMKMIHNGSRRHQQAETSRNDTRHADQYKRFPAVVFP